MTSHSEELDWLAFRYVAGELTESEAAAFELRLGDDLAACEAVARAVEISAAVATIEKQTHVVERRSSPLVAVWSRLAISLAACVLLTLGVRSMTSSQSSYSISPQLADVWSNSLADPLPTLADETLNDDDVATLDSLFDAHESPAWMLEALRSLRDDDAAGEEMES